MHEQLQDFLNECIKKGWKPRGFDTRIIRNGLMGFCYINGRSDETIASIHDLFSVESGLMEFVKWRRMDRHTAYIVMSDMTSEKKIKYFLNNALLPE